MARFRPLSSHSLPSARNSRSLSFRSLNRAIVPYIEFLLLERDVPVFASRVRVAFAGERAQGSYEAGTGLVRKDDVVDVATLRRDVRVREALDILRDQVLAQPVGILRFSEFVLVEDVHRPLGAHDR